MIFECLAFFAQAGGLCGGQRAEELPYFISHPQSQWAATAAELAQQCLFVAYSFFFIILLDPTLGLLSHARLT